MDVVAVLRNEHERIRTELSELDFIMVGATSDDSSVGEEGEGVNYSNLVHTFWKLCEFWESHEKMEEKVFPIMEREGFVVPVESIFLEHKKLRGRIKRINEAINSGSDLEVRKVLAKEMREFVDILRKHADDEDEILTGVIVANFSAEAVEEIKQIVLRAGKGG